MEQIQVEVNEVARYVPVAANREPVQVKVVPVQSQTCCSVCNCSDICIALICHTVNCVCEVISIIITSRFDDD